ncbi:MAG: DUF3180 domain-containing protein [Actinomycetes bacterium]
MKPTRLGVLVAWALVAGAVSYLVIREVYASLPRLPTLAPASLGLIALVEGILAFGTRNRLLGRPGTRPVEPILVARYAALAKASSIVGALALGAYAGVLVYVLPLRDAAQPRDDAIVAGFGAAAGLALVITAYALERVCRVKPPRDSPPQPDQQEESSAT